MNEPAEKLYAALKGEWPEVRIALDHFPSGAFLLDAYLNERQFQLAYYPSQCLFGVGEIRIDDSFTLGYPFSTDDFAEAEAEFRKLVDSADATNGAMLPPSGSKSVVS